MLHRISSITQGASAIHRVNVRPQHTKRHSSLYKTLQILPVCLLLLLIARQSLATSPSTIQSASELDYPPFAVVTPDGRADGFAVELLRAAAHAMGREIRFRVGAWNSIKQDLIEGRLDALPLVARTAERERQFDFTFPYLSMHGAIVVRKGDRRIATPADLKGRQVLVMRGDIAEEYVQTHQLSERLLTTPSLAEGLQRLASGDGDAMVVQKLAGEKLIDQMELELEMVGDPLPHYQEFSFAVQPGDRELLALLNEGLALVIANGTYDELRDRWLGPLQMEPSLPWPRILLIIAFSLLVAGLFGWFWQRTLVRQVEQRTRQLGEANQRLAEEIVERQAAEDILQRHREQLEFIVADRTAELQERSERYELVLAGAQDAIWDWNIPANTIHFSEQWSTLLGYRPEELSDRFEIWHEAIHPDDRPRIRNALDAHLAGDTPAFAEEYQILCRDGTWKWVSDRGVAKRNGQGQAIRMAGSVRDTTERRAAEQALQERERYYRLLVEQAVDGIFLSDASGRYLDVNSAGATMLGYTREELRQLTIADVIDPGEIPRIPPEVARFADGSVVRSEWRFRRKDGSLFPGEVVGRQLPDGRLQAFVRDITERHRTEELLRKADRQKDEFIATLAHELRNPLAPIRNALEILKQEGIPEEYKHSAREMIERQLYHMVRLMDDLLDVSRITRGKLVLRKEMVELTRLLQEVAEGATPTLQQKGQTLDLDLPSPPVLLDADPVRLAQVFSNLLNNASKYTQTGGAISLSASVDQEHVAIAVSDNGSGIEKEAQSRLFEMFTQVHPTSDAMTKGLGIGLAISRNLVMMHGGRIAVHSEGAGKGSRFSVTLPVAAEQPIGLDHTSNKARQSPQAGLHMLVVDDEPDILDSLAILLRLHGHRVDTARNGLEAVEQAGSLQPEVILMDVGMPKLDGYEACRRIREQPWSEDTSIIALTGWGQEEDRRKARTAGFDGYLVKPVEIADILDLLADRSTQLSGRIDQAEPKSA